MKLKARLIAFALVLCQFHLCAQKLEIIDSLKSHFALSKADTTKADILLSISMKYQGFNPDSSLTYAQSSLEQSIAADYTKGRADALLQIGRIERDLSKDTEALQHMFEALKLYRDINDSVQIANALNDISIIYANSGDYPNSLEYFKQALAIFQQTGDEKGESYALNNIGIIYQELKDTQLAKHYFLLSQQIKIKRNDLYGISRGYSNLGSLAENDHQWNEALMYYFRADSLYKLTKDIQAEASNLVAIADVKDKQGRSAEARKYAALALEKSQEVKSPAIMLSSTKLLAELEEKRYNYKASLEYQKLYNQLSDSVNNATHKSHLEELKAQFNVGEKEREIALLKKDKDLQQALIERKNIITWSLTAGIMLLLLMFSAVLYAYRTTRKVKNSLAAKNLEIQHQKDHLDKLNSEKDRFFSILSHDIRGPLNALKGFSYLLGHIDSMSTEELMQMKARIDKSLDNLTELINNILEWSMTSAGKRKWAFDKIDVSEIIKKNISLYQAIADSKNIKLLFPEENSSPAYGDYYALDTVVRNLLSNGIKFSHPDSEVVISNSKLQDRIVISVKDSGVGIPDHIQKKLFSLNGNVTQPGTANEKGSGLGLILCKELMNETKGDIKVYSQPGKGSEFIISVPAYSGQTATQPESVSAS